MIYEINKTDSEKLPLKSLQPKSKARSLYPWLFQSLSKPQVYLVTQNKKDRHWSFIFLQNLIDTYIIICYYK